MCANAEASNFCLELHSDSKSLRRNRTSLDLKHILKSYLIPHGLTSWRSSYVDEPKSPGGGLLSFFRAMGGFLGGPLCLRMHALESYSPAKKIISQFLSDTPSYGRILRLEIPSNCRHVQCGTFTLIYHSGRSMRVFLQKA